jgi:hypothetical protein
MARSVDNLSKMELAGTEDFNKYLLECKNVCKALAIETGSRADEIQAILIENTKGFDRLAGRMKARKVARQLKRVSEAAQRGMIHSARTWAVYRREYDVQQAKPKKVWKFDK